MKQSVFNLNVLKAHPERNAFDLSHNDVFSCAPGMLLPISCTEVLPNEHFEINPQIFLRTMPLNSAAFVRMRQHVEFFFVPTRVLCRQFSQFVVGTKYPISSYTQLNAFDDHLPALSLAIIRNWMTSSTGYDAFNIKLPVGATRLLDLLGYGFSSVRPVTLDNYPDSYKAPDVSDSQTSPSLSPFRLAAYQKVYQDFYRNPYWEAPDVSAFNFDDLFGMYLGKDVSRLDKLLQIRYRNWSKDFFTSIQPSFQGSPFVTKVVDLSNTKLNCATTTDSFQPTTEVSFVDHKLPVASPTKAFYTSALTSLYSDSSDDVKSLSIPVHNIRAAFALDKLYRLQQQSGNGSYGEQIRNRFGFGGVHDDWKSTYIGASSSAQ